MKSKLTLLLLLVSIMNSYSQERIVQSNNAFALDIYNATKNSKDNFFISPFSLYVALSAVNEGAGSSTKDEIDRLLSLKGLENPHQQYSRFLRKTLEFEDADFKKCMAWSEDTSGRNSLFLANSLWINNEVSINENFIKRIKENFHSDIFTFNNQNIFLANKELNEWVSEKTQKKISAIAGFNGDIKLSMVNAISFSGEWKSPFDTRKTKKSEFSSIDKKKEEIDFMNMQQRFRYYEDSNVQSLSLPYKCEQFSMIILLPKKRYGIAEVENNLNIRYLKNIDSLSFYYDVILSLPRFRIESEIKPKKDLIKEGFSIMFSDKADFSGISSKDSLKIGEIIHKTFIEIDERKTEAAAVSKVDMVVVGYGGGNPAPPPPPKIFNANHPFVFLIKDNRTKAILFMGRYVKE